MNTDNLAVSCKGSLDANLKFLIKEIIRKWSSGIKDPYEQPAFY